jgi:ferredoxin-type protein NapH
MTLRQRIRRTTILLVFLLFPLIINYLSPYLIIAGSAQGIINGSLLFFALLFIFSLVFGRAFCGWACPGTGLGEALILAQPKAARGGNWIKYVIWVPWIGLIAWSAITADGYHSVNPLFMIESGISVAEPRDYFTYFGVVGIIVTLSLTTGRRGFCHYVCWMAPFMVIGTKLKDAIHLPSLRLKSTASNCKGCKTCEANCPMSLPVAKMVASNSMANSECVLCGSCVDGCPEGAIKFSWKHNNPPNAAGK